MKENMKTERLVARVDQKTFELINEASELSGIPVSKIVRKGSLAEAIQIISMCKELQHVATNNQQKREG